VVNWEREILKWECDKDNFTILTKEQFRKRCQEVGKREALIFDECHHVENYSSKLFKNTQKYIKIHNIERVYLLTGTPYRVNSFNIWCLGILLGENWPWWEWRNKFFYMVKKGYREWPVQKTHIDGIPTAVVLNGIINKLGNTVKLSDVAGELEDENIIEYFDITSEQRNAIQSLSDSTVVALITKQLQIENGTLKSDGYSQDKYFKSEKFTRALEIIEDNPKIIVVCRHKLEIKRFNEEIKDRTIYTLDGSTSSSERQDIMDKFNKATDAICLVQAQVCEGYSLFSPVMMFYSISWGLVEYLQIKARPLMPDKKNIITYIHLLIKDKTSIDYKVYDNVVIKKQNFSIQLYE